MSENKAGIFSVIFVALTLLLIMNLPININAQSYEDELEKVGNNYYDADKYYAELEHGHDGIYSEDDYIYKESYYPSKDNINKDPSMLLVKKEVLVCDSLIDSSQLNSTISESDGCANLDQSPFFIEGPNSGRYVACDNDNELCQIDESFFDISIDLDKIDIKGSAEGVKLNFDGQPFNVKEETPDINAQFDSELANLLCRSAGFDSGLSIVTQIPEPEEIQLICTLNQGECSGVIPEGVSKECTVKNYIAEVITVF